MPLLGAHMSIAGGLHKALERMEKIGGDCLQIFTRNQRQWHSRPLDALECQRFRQLLSRLGRPLVFSHASYLINLATSSRKLAEKSINALSMEIERCGQLGIPWVVIHPGSHRGEGVEKGIKNVIKNLDKVFSASGMASNVGILLETVAGQGTSIGSSFQEMASIIERSAHSSRIGVCIDTCHIFAAGYDIRKGSSYMDTIRRMDETFGLERIKLFHLNDSKKELGSRVDRHEHIGKGKIGEEGFRLLLNDKRFQNHPMILETPKGKDMKEDIENLHTLKKLLIKK